MRVEHLDVQLVARGPAEAQDLGLQLLRRHAWPTFGAVLAVMAPIWALALYASAASAWVGSLAIWWIKPLIDRVVVHVLSRAAFGATPRIRETLAALPSMIDRPLLELLTWRRLGLRRSLWLPVASLEGVRGKDLSGRYREVSFGTVGQEAAISTLVFLHIEFALATAGFLLALWLLPDGWLPDVLSLLVGDAPTAVRYQWLSFATWLPGLLICEVAYAAAGFGLYVSRRTELEGWNIELAFQRLGTRLADAARRGIAIALPLLVCLALSSGASAGTSSLDQDATGDGGSRQALETTDPVEIARDVLSHSDFDTTREQTFYTPAWDIGGGDSTGIAELIATVLKALGWILVGVIVIALVVYIARNAESRASTRDAPPRLRPVEAFGLDLREESLPEDIVGAAKDLARQGAIVPCLSLLYRGALHRLMTDDALDIFPGDTEHDCIRRVNDASTETSGRRAAYFEELTGSWLEAAWGQSPPLLDDALALCDGWGSHIGSRERLTGAGAGE